ncbi:hypothetical protein HETIRDRAFT_328638 [Heterobasidion irregulare TC 32-1]|uniref:Carbohydrate-binding module family 19 domain-containing protein n=1 Tax=Heterobasidion irregulare (strain TC 32-1) TaxID=747525 RepID=W4JTI6_HETIT|nr:uncharacterized protein HETIRDRAFT_328638 [Heterobasidion irregulare TC 32-1]ETW76838.1 hypothetical protein HETIRDRAFT_328638 [Heterobasidion irregulare TC 32-1]
MVQLSSVLVSCLLASAASARPFQKRISQTISDSTAAWVQACTAAGGAAQCGTISQTAFTSLLAAGKNCDQQDAADSMIDLAKQLNNNAEMIRLAQIFVQQPRNAPDSLQVPYCQTAPRNVELDGLFHCQFASSDFTKFSGDQTGNVPLGLAAAVSPPGSCPAKPDGPVPDGVQLNTLVQSPGTPATAAAASTDAADPTTADAPADNAAAGGAAAAATPASTPATTSASSSSFTLQNGLDAQALNAQFATLTAASPCQDGAQACVGGAFAQCVGGKFVTTSCAGGAQCFALPLVNKAGTSITCSTEADAAQRIAATGATGGVTGA